MRANPSRGDVAHDPPTRGMRWVFAVGQDETGDVCLVLKGPSGDVWSEMERLLAQREGLRVALTNVLIASARWPCRPAMEKSDA